MTATADDLRKLLESDGAIVVERIEHLLSSQDIPRRLAESIRYSVLAGGKRLRPVLVMESRPSRQRRVVARDASRRPRRSS